MGFFTSFRMTGITTVTLQRSWTAPAKGGGPPADGVGVPSQSLRRGRGGPALGQQQESVPSFPLPGRGARIIRLCKSLASIRHCSRNCPISLTPITNPSLTPGQTNLTPSQLYPMLLRISPWLWFRRHPATILCAGGRTWWFILVRASVGYQGGAGNCQATSTTGVSTSRLSVRKSFQSIGNFTSRTRIRLQ